LSLRNTHFIFIAADARRRSSTHAALAAFAPLQPSLLT
jgi:hypothetical protein